MIRPKNKSITKSIGKTKFLVILLSLSFLDKYFDTKITKDNLHTSLG